MNDVNQFIEKYKNEIISSAQQLISIKSIQDLPSEGKPFGKGVHDALQYALGLCKKLGFDTVDVDGYLGYAEAGQGDETLGILVHLDVVPDGPDWTYPPYGAEIHQNKIYGRGAVDDKGPAVAIIYALKAVMDLNRKFKRKVRIILGCSEENAWDDLNYYKKTYKMPDYVISPDAEYPIINTEKGIMHISLKKEFSNKDNNGFKIIRFCGGSRVNIVPDHALCVVQCDKKMIDDLNKIIDKFKYNIEIRKCSENYEIISIGVSAHGSTPEKGVNAVTHLIDVLNDLKVKNPQLDFLNFISTNIDNETDGNSLGIKVSDQISGELSLNLGVFNMGGNAAKADIDIRYPVLCNSDELLKQIRSKAAADGIEVIVNVNKPAHHVPEDHFLVSSLKKVYKEVTGKEAYTVSMGGGTYARSVENGVAFGPLLPGKPYLAHEKDEYIEIDDILLNVKMYEKAITEIACK